LEIRDLQVAYQRRFPIYDLFILAAYFLLTILMTWPTILHLTDGIPGDGFDGWQNYWNLWWIKQALLVEGRNPYFTDYIYPPAGASLLFHTLNIFNGWWTLPIQLNFGLAIAYNSIVFFSFVMAGYGAYLLSLYTLVHCFPTGRGLRPAAFVGGVVFTMSPFHMAHLLGHMQVFSMVWPPFYVLWLLRTLDPESPSNRPFLGQWRNVVVSTLFLVLASLVAWYHTLYLLIFTGLVLLWTIWRRWRASGRTRAYVIQPLLVVLGIGLGFALILAPTLVPMIRDASNRPDLETGLFQNITLSADLLAFITPSEMHPLWGKWASSIGDNFTAPPSERLIFAGFVPLGLAIFVLVRTGIKSLVKFWGLITAAFLVLSLGPFLHIGGKIVAIGGWQIPMPYLLLYHTIPFIDLTRSLSRYDLMVMLGLGVLTALAIAQLQLSTPNYQSLVTKSRTPILSEIEGTHQPSRTFNLLALLSLPASLLWLPLLATSLILFEFLAVPYPISKIDTPQFYYDIARHTEDYTIAELPMNWDRPTPMLHQTVHRKRVLTAYTSRSQSLDLTRRSPVLQHWRYLSPDIIDQPLEKIAPTIFFDFNLRYIVLDYWQMPPGPEREGTERWVAAALPGVAPMYDDGRLKVYQSPPKDETYPYLSLGDGWSDRQEHSDGFILRAFSADQAQPPKLFLHHPQNQPLTLKITAATDQNLSPTVTIFAGDESIDTFQISQIFSVHAISLPPSDTSLLKLSLEVAPPTGHVFVNRVGLSLAE
jgi:hypothetical protein